MTKENKKNTKEKNLNPYLNGKLVYTDYLGSLIGNRNIWIVTALLSISLSFVLACGIVYIGSQSKYIPYVIEVDKLGNIQNLGVVNPSADSFQNPRIINLMLNDIVIDLRTVSVDSELTTQRLAKLYSKLADRFPAKTKINEFFHEDKNNPYLRNQKETVSVVVQSILRSTNTTYTIEWTENTHNLKGEVISTDYYKGVFTIEFMDVSQKDFDELLKNPAGLYLKDFDIQKI